MISLLFAFIAAAMIGAGDYVGGLASRRTPATVVVAVSAVVSFVGVLLIAFTTPSVLGVTVAALISGIVAGVLNGLGAVLLFTALARGPMSVVSPLAAMSTTVVSGAAGIGQGESVPPAVVAGGVLALSSVGVLAPRDSRTDGRGGVMLGLGAGLLLGGYVVALDQTPTESGFAPVVVSRLIITLISFGLVMLHTRGRPTVARARWSLMLVLGLLDVTASLAGFLAVHGESLVIAGPVMALHPAITVTIAGLLGDEKPTKRQMTGLGMSVTSLGILSMA
jgi:drug/metabolite transporter (DMT)-like permease